MWNFKWYLVIMQCYHDIYIIPLLKKIFKWAIIFLLAFQKLLYNTCQRNCLEKVFFFALSEKRYEHFFVNRAIVRNIKTKCMFKVKVTPCYAVHLLI